MNTVHLWAFIRPDGSLFADTRFASEHDAWWIGLGFPDVEEIEQAKRDGYRVERITITGPHD